MVKEVYLKTSLTKLYNVMEKSVEIIQWSENKGSAAEDGFTTELVAVKGTANITNKMQNFSFMIKLTPEIGHRVNMVKEMGLFVKEFLFYGVILPIIEKERITKGLESLSIPRCFYVHPDPGVLVMNNLKDMGFDLLKNRPRNSSTNFQDNEIILFMKSLASLHASTH